MGLYNNFGVLGRHGVINAQTFKELLDNFEGDELNESRNMVAGFFDTADFCFEQMSAALAKPDFGALETATRKLESPSNTLGLEKVVASCEQIRDLCSGERTFAQLGLDARFQNIVSGKFTPKDYRNVARLAEIIKGTNEDYRLAKIDLCNFYRDGPPVDDEE